MTFGCILALLLTQVCAVSGQVLLKLAVTPGPKPIARAPRWLVFMVVAIALLTIRFFVWLGLMTRFDLSFLYPFEALEPLLLVLAAAVFLREKLTWRIWLGVLLITGGVALVSLSDASTTALDPPVSLTENE